MCAGNQTQVLYKNAVHSKLPTHLSSLRFILSTGVWCMHVSAGGPGSRKRGVDPLEVES